MILLVHAPLKEATELAKKLPDFDLVVAAGEAETPPARLTELKDVDTRVVQLGYKGMYVGVVAFFGDIALDHQLLAKATFLDFIEPYDREWYETVSDHPLYKAGNIPDTADLDAQVRLGRRARPTAHDARLDLEHP